MPDRISIGNNDVAVRTLLAEAAGEGERGMLASAAVAVNRAKQTNMSLSEIFTQRGQFEPHMNEAGRARMARFRPGTPLWQTAERAIARALGGEDPTNGADHFWSPEAQAAAGRQPPAWGRSGGTMIGRHSFHRIGYRNRDRRFYGPSTGVDTDTSAPAPATPAMPALTSTEALSGGRGRGTLTGSQILAGEQPAPRASATAGAPRRAAGAIFSDVLTAQTAGPDGRATPNNVGREEVENSFLGNAARDTWAAKFDNPMDRLANSVYLNSLTGEVARAVHNHIEGNEPGRWDEGFNYTDNMEELEAGLGMRDVNRLREESRSLEDARRIRADIEDRNTRQEVVGTGLLENLAGGLIDPLGYLAGAGIGKTIQGLGVGSRVLALQGNRAGAVASLAAEGAVGNLAVTAAMDAVGMYATPNDYVAAGMFGAAMGAGLSPFVIAGNRPQNVDAELRAITDNVVTVAAKDELRVLTQATAVAGPEATPESIGKAAEQIHAEEAATPLINTANPIPRVNQILTEDHVIAPERQAAVDAITVGISDDSQRGIAAAMLDRAGLIDEANPHRDATVGEQSWLNTGLASSGLVMLRSKFGPMRGLAKILAEGASGHNGRQHSAALEVIIRDTELNRGLLGWDSNFDLWRKSRGYSVFKRVFGDGSVDREFNALVFAEVRGRGRPDLYAPSSDPTIRAAADMLQANYKKAGEEQVRWKTVGHEAIKDDPSYVPQMVSAETIKRLGSVKDVDALAPYRAIISEQARGIFGWDKKFADYFGRRYIETAQNRATGGYDAPVNLAHHQAGDFVSDLLDNMRQGASKEDLIMIDKTSAAFARGGASFTKGRLDFDVMHSYPQKDGSSIRLLDIMEQDMLGLARRYNRRAAGEIALVKVGIPGKFGVDILRKSMAAAAAKDLVSVDELKAFDQLMAEITNTPMGGNAKNSVAMENLRLITSAIKLGGMGITQFAESGNGMAAVGVARTFASIAAMPRLVSEIKGIRTGKVKDNPILNSLEKANGYEFGLTDYISDRAFDVRDNEVQLYATEQLGVVSKAARGLSHLQAVYSGQRLITAIQTRGMAEQIVRKAMLDIKSGVANTKALEDMGFTPELQKKLHDNMDKIAKFKGNTLVSTDIRAGNLTDGEIAQIVGSVQRGASQIIQRTYPGEVGKWAHDDFLKLLFQFRTFSITAVEKQWGRNIKTHGHMKAFLALVGSMAFAAPIHYARVNAKTLGMAEDEREEYLEKNLGLATVTQATLNYASASGLLGDVWDIGGGAVSGMMAGVGVEAPDWLSSTINPRGTGNNQQLLGGKIAPAAGVVQDAFSVANGRWDRIRSLLPGQAHPALAPLLTAGETAIAGEE